MPRSQYPGLFAAFDRFRNEIPLTDVDFFKTEARLVAHRRSGLAARLDQKKRTAPHGDPLRSRDHGDL